MLIHGKTKALFGTKKENDNGIVLDEQIKNRS